MDDAPRCIGHPDRPGAYYCSKYAEHLCDECMACRDPRAYCTFRGSCMINELRKRAARVKRGVTSHRGGKILD